MTWQTVLYFTSVLLTFAQTCFLAWFAWRRQRSLPGSPAFAGLALVTSLLAMVEALSMISRNQLQAQFWFDLRFLFTSIIPVLFLIFAFEFNRRGDLVSHPLLAAGHEINIIYPDDYGIHNYGDTLVVSDALTHFQPDLVLRFLRATLQGWTSTVENPSSVGSAVRKYNSSADSNLENQKMIASLPLINTGEDYIGWMRPKIWVGMEQMLCQQGELTSSQEMMSQVINMQFLEAIYK
jgi:hypothetical protein